MSTDPYHVVKDEIQSTLQAAETLLSSYRRIHSTAREDSEELNYAKSEVRATSSSNCPGTEVNGIRIAIQAQSYAFCSRGGLGRFRGQCPVRGLSL